MDEKREKDISRKGESIAYQNKDITAKILAEEFKGKSFEVYGVDIPKIISVEPTNLPAIEANELRMDNLFYLEDDSYLLVDYESEYNEENKIKYLNYIVRVSKRLYNELEKFPNIRMLVIYTADVKKGSTDPAMNLGSVRLVITEAFLSELDNEEIWDRISSKVFNKQELASEEVMELIVYPLTFQSKKDKQDAIADVITLTKQIAESNRKSFIFKCLLTFTDKVIRDEDAEAIKEALMMTKVEKLIYQDAEADVTKRIAKNLLGSGSNIDYVVENTGLKKETVVELYNNIMAEKQQ